MQAVLVVGLRRRVAEPLAGDHVHDHRAAVPAGAAQRVLDQLLVVTVHRAQVLDAEVLEEHLRLQHVLEALLDPVQRLVQGRAEQRGARQGGLDVLQHVLVALRHPDRGQVRGEPADRRRVGAAVVVDHDDQPAVLRVGDVVERFPGHAAGQRAVADHRDHRSVVLAPHLVGLGQPVRVGQGGGRVRVLHDVVLGLGLVRVPGHTAALLQPGEAVLPPGEHLVHVGLVPGVEHDPVGRGVEDPVQRDGQLDHAEVGPEVPPVAGHGLDQEVADFAGQRGQLVGAERLEIPGTGDGLQQSHLVCSFSSAAWPAPAVSPCDHPSGRGLGPGTKREP